MIFLEQYFFIICFKNCTYLLNSANYHLLTNQFEFIVLWDILQLQELKKIITSFNLIKHNEITRIVNNKLNNQ